jgi:biopolymer transport protein ExbD
MLLVFFLVTSSMDTDKGLFRQLPPAPQAEEQTLDVRESDVLRVSLDAADHLTCQGDTIAADELTARVMQFAKDRGPAHVVAVQTHRRTTYDAYFTMQSAIASAYRQLGCQQRISESEPIDDDTPQHKKGGAHD